MSGPEFFCDPSAKLNHGSNDFRTNVFCFCNFVCLNRFFELLAGFEDLRCVHVGDSTFETMCCVEEIVLVAGCEGRRQKFEAFFAGRVEQFSQFSERSRIVAEKISDRLMVELDRLISEAQTLRFWDLVLRCGCYVRGYCLDFKTRCMRCRFAAGLVMRKVDIPQHLMERAVMV